MTTRLERAARRKSGRFRRTLRQTETAGGVSVGAALSPTTDASGGVMISCLSAALMRSAISGLLHGARSKSCGLLWSTCAHGNRAAVCGPDSRVEMCASLFVSVVFDPNPKEIRRP